MQRIIRTTKTTCWQSKGLRVGSTTSTGLDEGRPAERSIGIIGGGIGGIAAAVALHQAGINVMVYERAGALREVGVGMMLWPNATRVLQEWGLLSSVVARSGPNTRFLVRNSAGDILMNIALGEFEVPAVSTRRSDLLGVLLGALPPGRVQLGHDLANFEERGEKVHFRFKNGQVAKHDAAIGADGIGSTVRSQIFGAARPIYRGYTVWRGLAEYKGDAIPAGCNSETWGAGKRFGILHTGQNQYTWYAAANVPANHADADRGRKDELLQMFDGWHAPVGELIRASEDSGILKHGARDFASMRHWGVGRVTLLGDAAHSCTPNLGQGGNMALEDAAVLAKVVARGRSLRTALREYEALRMGRTRGIQQRSRLMGRVGQWQHPLLINGRDAVTRLLPARLVESNLRRIYGYKT